MHESALFLLGLLVAESSVYQPAPVCVLSSFVLRIQDTIHVTVRCICVAEGREKGMIGCVRAHASASFYKPAKGSVTDSLVEYRWIARFFALLHFLSLSFLFLLLFLSSSSIPPPPLFFSTFSVSFFVSTEEQRKTASMFGNDPRTERIDVSQEFILIYGTAGGGHRKNLFVRRLIISG